MIISKNCQNCIEIKFEIENVDFVRQKLWVENVESKILSDFKLNYNKNVSGRIDGWVDGWMYWWEGKPGLLNWWVNELMGGIKLNYNGGPFSKVVRFLKFKLLIILKLNYNGGQFYKK